MSIERLASSQRPLLDLVLAPDSLRMLVQPIVFSREGAPPVLHSVECLTRGPAGTNLERPDILFEYVRRKHRESEVDRVCSVLAFDTMSTTSLAFSINIHASTLGRDAEFVDFLLRRADAAEVSPQRITVEIVEHAPLWSSPSFLSSLDQLRSHGFHIALDDIGFGQSNFRMILECRPDYFKIDRFFISGCDRDRYRRAVIESILQLSRRFEGEVIAEGVETEEERAALAAIGVELMQGFLFCRPTSVGPAGSPGAGLGDLSIMG